MRIAFLLAGQTRNWNKSFEYYKELDKLCSRSGIQSDFFLSTWDKEGTRAKDYEGSDPIEIPEGFFKAVSVDTVLDYHPGSSYYMSNRWKRAIEIRQKYETENNLTYDLVVLTRPDIVIWEYKYFIDRCLFLGSERGMEWNNPLTILTEVGSTVHFKVYPEDYKQDRFAGRIEYSYFSDDKVIVGHPLAVDTFKGLFEDLIGQRILSSQHLVIVDHCFKHKLLNSLFFVKEGLGGVFRLNRDCDYPNMNNN